MSKMKWMRLLVVSALAFGTVACGDDDTLPFDAGGTDAGPSDVGPTDVPLLGDVGPGPDAGPDPDAGPTPDAGGPDGGPDPDAGGPDGGPDPDAGPMFNPAATAQITAVRDAAEGAQDPALAVEDAIVTYVKPAIGSDPAAFFVQGEPEGPALYVAVDPDTLDPIPAPGDTVTFNVTETEIAGSGGQHRVLAITDFARSAEGFNTDALVQDLSDVGDVITALGDYESELVTATGTITDSFGFAGTDHSGADFMTMMIDDASLIVRIPNDVLADSGLIEGCSFTAGPAPMWRFNDTAQFSVFNDTEISAVTCPAPTVVSAAATDEVTVSVTFSSALDAASVAAADFAIADITVSDAVVDGLNVTLTVADMVAGTDYTVTVTGVTDTFGTDIDAAANTAMFTGVGPDLGALLITEVIEGSGSGNKAIEITNVGAGVSNLASCVLARHANGAVVGSPLPALSGTLAAGESFVACHSSFPDPTMTICDMVSSSINHNGNDAYSLTCDDVVVDTFGIAVRASSMDPAADTFSGMNGMGQALSGANMTLRRLCSVTGTDADTDLSDDFDIGTQWDASTPADPTMSFDDLSGLGEHCP